VAFDILAANQLGKAPYSPLYEESETPNTARFVFLSASAAELFLDFDKAQNDVVAFLRAEARPLGSGGPPMTSAAAAPAPSGCTTRSSAR
jgi:hypothetical protein